MWGSWEADTRDQDDYMQLQVSWAGRLPRVAGVMLDANFDPRARLSANVHQGGKLLT
jgi:hypothetical protein